jgi:hypothetical protein
MIVTTSRLFKVAYGKFAHKNEKLASSGQLPAARTALAKPV